MMIYRYNMCERSDFVDQVKIGKFIAERRKAQGLTQLQLSEKLHVTDKAVSKWERGKSMPDSSIMPALCRVLDITVNDLLSGEAVSVDNYNKELENNLMEMIRQKEQMDRCLLKIEWVLGILSAIILIIPTLIGSLVPMEEWQRVAIIFAGLIPAVVGFAFAMKIEQVAGYYECKHCGHRYVPTYKDMNLAMHVGRKRYLKCPKCGKKSWQKKVISKE